MARKKTRRSIKSKQPEKGGVKKRSAPDNREKKPTKSFLKRLVQALPLVVLALLFTFVLNRAGLFNELETTFLDIQMRMSMPKEESDVVIVDIDENDFADIFKGQRSPLNPPVLQQVVDAIARGEPCVVGVDIDTGFDQFRSFRTEHLDNFVWARDFQDASEIIPRGVLGSDVTTGREATIRSALPRTISEKGVTRYYSRMVETNKGNLPSFGWAIFEEARRRKCPGIAFPDLEATDETLTIGFSRGASGTGRTRIPASHILKFDEGNWENKELIKGKIVLLGGSYLNEDRRPTPLGMMNGFSINANIIETELRGGGVKPPGAVTVVLLLVFDSVLLMALFQLFPWRQAVLLSLPFILVLSLACSLFTYWSFSHWAFFAPVMLGVLGTELFDKAKDHFKKRYKQEITETYQELSGLSGEASEARPIER
jgi:hypothetical protein